LGVRFSHPLPFRNLLQLLELNILKTLDFKRKIGVFNFKNYKINRYYDIIFM